MNSPDIPLEEQITIWTGLFIGGQTNGAPINFEQLKTDAPEIDSLREAVGASIGRTISAAEMHRAIDAVSVTLKNRAI